MMPLTLMYAESLFMSTTVIDSLVASGRKFIPMTSVYTPSDELCCGSCPIEFLPFCKLSPGKWHFPHTVSHFFRGSLMIQTISTPRRKYILVDQIFGCICQIPVKFHRSRNVNFLSGEGAVIINFYTWDCCKEHIIFTGVCYVDVLHFYWNDVL